MSPTWVGQCPDCHAWNTLKAQPKRKADVPKASVQTPVPLASVAKAKDEPYSSGLTGLDRVLGKGLVPGGAYLIGGEPGIGKSTLLLQVAGLVASQGKMVLYASGEEALPQIRDRAERLDMLDPNLMAMATSQSADIVGAIESFEPTLVIVDSVQTIVSASADGLPGTVSQIRAVCAELMAVCRSLAVTLIIVGHVTKDGVLAGPKLLEHMVDCVIALEGDRRQMFRLLRVFKNRFGANEELLVFRMQPKGLAIIDDPSTFFLSARDPSLSGTALVMAVDGQRPLAVEVQALVCRSYLAIPRRTALGFDVNRLHLLLAVLEKRLALNFSNVDIYAKVGGGIRLQEPGLDLALVSAVLSSYYDTPLPEKAIFWGEVDLNGQIRPVSAHELRAMQAKRLGFAPVFYPKTEHGDGIGVLKELEETVFHR